MSFRPYGALREEAAKRAGRHLHLAQVQVGILRATHRPWTSAVQVSRRTSAVAAVFERTTEILRSLRSLRMTSLS
jgi:hypothetical protein